MKGRKPLFKKEIVVRMRFDEPTYLRLRDIAALESIHQGKIISSAELIRQAVNFVYEDNERLREAFRRIRSRATKRYRN